MQNILVTRFANGIFEPVWNRNFIEDVEVTSSESIGIESRGGYYDNSGALRDMIQNHLLQLVGYAAMEPPSVFDSKSIRDESLKVFQALRPIKSRGGGEACNKRSVYFISYPRKECDRLQGRGRRSCSFTY